MGSGNFSLLRGFKRGGGSDHKEVAQILRGCAPYYLLYRREIFQGWTWSKRVDQILRESMTLDGTFHKFCTLNIKFVIKIWLVVLNVSAMNR